MKKFLKRIIVFFTIFGLIFLFGIFLPVTPGAKKNMLAYKIQKDSMLTNVKSPRIIFIGGSNLVFGLNSQIVKDSLRKNPINAGLAASIGLFRFIYCRSLILQPREGGGLNVRSAVESRSWIQACNSIFITTSPSSTSPVSLKPSPR